MQILQWLFKKAQEQQRNSSTLNLQHQKEDINEKNGKGKEINSLSLKRIKRYEWRKNGYKNLKIFTFLYRRKDIPKACFYSTLNIKRIGFHRRRFLYSTKMKKAEESSKGNEVNVNKTDSTVHVGNKVLPIIEAVPTAERNNDQCDTTLSKDQIKDAKKKPISRMKELLRWAASAKSEKGGKFNGKKVLMFRRRGNLKAVPDEDQLCIDSPKISFRWDMESCSTTCSAYSAISMASSSRNGLATSTNSIPPAQIGHSTCRKGNWITTDSDFVVLEL